MATGSVRMGDFMATYPSTNIANHLAFITPPGAGYFPVLIDCGDAVPRCVAGMNWDGNWIIYCPTIETGTFTNTVYWNHY